MIKSWDFLVNKSQGVREKNSTFLTGGDIMIIRVVRFPWQEFKAIEEGAESKDLWELNGCLLLSLHDILRSVRSS